jgi:hypothetical protein
LPDEGNDSEDERFLPDDDTESRDADDGVSPAVRALMAK